jgi:predicted MPP superfamily phosphohydrolase
LVPFLRRPTTAADIRFHYTSGMKINRRSFLAGLGAAGAALGADAFGLEASRVEVTRHDLRVPNLPSFMDGIRIGQVSDVHFPGNQLAARATLEHLHREGPEIVVLNGDMTERLEAASQVREFAANARGSLATVAILGNWEYRAGMVGEAAREAYQGTGVELLVNQTKVVSLGSSSLALVGLDDVLMGRPDLSNARRGLPPGSLEVWLFHEPVFADTVPPTSFARPIMLMAGHTHGGQIRIPFVPPVKPVGAGRFLEGWYRDTVAPLYVTHGVGTTGIPARFRCAAELPIFTLRPA